MSEEKTSVKLVWYMLQVVVGLLIMVVGAWANMLDTKIEKLREDMERRFGRADAHMMEPGHTGINERARYLESQVERLRALHDKDLR